MENDDTRVLKRQRKIREREKAREIWKTRDKLR